MAQVVVQGCGATTSCCLSPPPQRAGRRRRRPGTSAVGLCVCAAVSGGLCGPAGVAAWQQPHRPQLHNRGWPMPGACSPRLGAWESSRVHQSDQIGRGGRAQIGRGGGGPLQHSGGGVHGLSPQVTKRSIRPTNPMQHALPPGRRPVRTLLLDNYDSYTFNLYQALAVINGAPPLVHHNDDCGGDFQALLAAIGGMPDSIVISPGPGHPALKQDFGMCMEVLQTATDVPILGVCLGHEGLAIAHGAEVTRAPVPMHGRLSPVYHNNDALFKGIGQGFPAVRYHSLAVDHASLLAAEERGGALRATAWASDGVVMALRHTQRPHWGVQFHPESVGTEAGARMLRNFRDLTMEWHAARGARWSAPRGDSRRQQRTPQPRQQHFSFATSASSSAAEAEEAAAKAAVPTARLVAAVVEWDADPEVAFEALIATSTSTSTHTHTANDSEGSDSESTMWWLDSSSLRRPPPSAATASTDGGSDDAAAQKGLHPARARYSFMGAGALEPQGVDTLEYYGSGVTVETVTAASEGVGAEGVGAVRRQRRAVRGDLLEVLRERVGARPQAGGSDSSSGGGGSIPWPVTVELAHPSTDGGGEDGRGAGWEWAPPAPAAAALPFDFWGGYVGYFGYEMRKDTTRAVAGERGGRAWSPAPAAHSTSPSTTDSECCEDCGEGGGGVVCGADPAVPVGFWVRADRYLAFDHSARRAYAVAAVPAATDGGDGGSGSDAREWAKGVAARLRQLNTAATAAAAAAAATAVNGGAPPSAPRAAAVNGDAAATDVSSGGGGGGSGGGGGGLSVCTSRSKARYEQDLREVLALIDQGETYEVCLTNQVVCTAAGAATAAKPCGASAAAAGATEPAGAAAAEGGEGAAAVSAPLEVYRRLRRKNPAPYAAFLLHDPAHAFARPPSATTGTATTTPSSSSATGTDTSGATGGANGSEEGEEGGAGRPPPAFAVCCSSPERFVRLDREGVIESKPIKGTSPRGRTPQEDNALAQALATSEKAVAENLMIVDLVRNDMGRVCKVGSVYVPKLMAIETYATVHQMVTTVRGQLRAGLTALDAVAAAFPPGSMTGAPKVRTMEIIDKLEAHAPRGVYSGSLGFLSRGGQADLNVVIRTGVMTPGRVSVGAGGAVIALSDVDDEYEEMLLKSRAVLQALGIDAPSTITTATAGDGGGAPVAAAAVVQQQPLAA